MDRETFSTHVAKTLEEVIALAEFKVQKPLSRAVAFQWLGKGQVRVREKVVDYIVQRVFVDSEHIYPCVDIGVGDVLEDGTLLIVANVAGYPPGPFQRNWTGRDGPFVHIVGAPFLERMSGKTPSWPQSGSFGYVTGKFTSRR
jgi:hypothetical protein